MWNNKHDLAWIPQDRRYPRSIVGLLEHHYTSYFIHGKYSNLAPVLAGLYRTPNFSAAFGAHEKETGDMNLVEYFYATTTHT